ncbi:hypothetical protein N9D08_01280 [bacterium]|nr:hypothetical protein [bacterium]
MKSRTPSERSTARDDVRARASGADAADEDAVSAVNARASARAEARATVMRASMCSARGGRAGERTSLL